MKIFALNGVGQFQDNPSEIAVQLDEWRKRYAKTLTKSFLESSARLFLKHLTSEESDDRNAMLEEEFDNALQYSVRIWAQRSSIRVWDLGRFGAQTSNTLDHNCSEIYRTQATKGPEQLEGRPVVLVVQPAIVAFGTEEGYSYDRPTRAWIKAQIWFGGSEAAKNDGGAPNFGHDEDGGVVLTPARDE